MRKENEILAVRSLEATDWPKQSQQATYPPFCISVAILYAPIKAVHTVAPQVILSIKMWNWDITVTIWAKSCNLGFMQSKTIFFRWTKFIVIKLKYNFCKYSLLNYIVFNNKKNVWWKKLVCKSFAGSRSKGIIYDQFQHMRSLFNTSSHEHQEVYLAHKPKLSLILFFRHGRVAYSNLAKS